MPDPRDAAPSLPIKGIFFTYRITNNLPEAQLRTLERLENDEQMAAVWDALARRQVAPGKVSTLLFRILEIEALARHAAELPAAFKQASERFKRLSAEAGNLADCFDAIPVPEIDADFAIESAKELNRNIRDCRRLFRWAQEFIAKMSDTNDRVFKKEVPLSQKREPVPSFSVMLSRTMDSFFGQPSHELVAVITSVVFETPEPIDPQTVRQAWRRDRERRSAKED